MYILQNVMYILLTEQWCDFTYLRTTGDFSPIQH